MRSQFKSFTIAVLALLMLTGCGSITANSTDSQLAANYDGADTKVGMVETSQAAIDRQLIQTASIALRVDDVAETATAITSYVNGIQGRIDSKNEYRNPDSSALPLCLVKPMFLLGQCAGVGLCYEHLTTATPHLN